MRVATPEVGSGPYNPCSAPTDPLGGPTPPPSLAAAACSGRGAGRVRILPRLRAALYDQAVDALLRAARRHDLVGARGQPAGTGAGARVPAQLALRGPARLRGGGARGAADRAVDGRGR